MNGISTALGKAAKVTRGSFTDLVAYLLLGDAVIVLTLTAMFGVRDVVGILTSHEQISVVLLIVFGYPAGFILSLVGDMAFDGIRRKVPGPRKGKHVADPGVGLTSGSLLVGFLFSSVDELDRPAPVDITEDTILWMAETVLHLAPDQMPGSYAVFQRQTALLRLTTAVLGATVLGVIGFSAAALFAWLDWIPGSGLTFVSAAAACAAVIPVVYTKGIGMNDHLTREIVQMGVAIAARSPQE